MLRSCGELGDVLQSWDQKGSDLLGIAVGCKPDFSVDALYYQSVYQALS